MADTLEYPNIWRLSSRYGGCSCHYRHLVYESTALGFGEPEDWFPEDADDVEATKAAYDVLAELVKQGHKVDIVDFWNSEVPDLIQHVVVDLDQVSRETFRFWEGCRFELKSAEMSLHPNYR